MTKLYITFFIAILFLGCKAQKFSLVENSSIKIINAYYKKIPPAIKEDKSTTQLFVKIEENKSIELTGVYFNNRYVNQNTKGNKYELITNLKELKVKEKIPFELEHNEIVIVYLENGKKKFAKFTIQKKKNWDNIPR